MTTTNAAVSLPAEGADSEPTPSAEDLAGYYRRVRRRSLECVSTLSDEDMGPQSMPDASPAKWHLAHTSWFFETFVLDRFAAAHAPFDAQFRVLFNSYYEAVGPRPARETRGLMTRPSVEQVRRYRAHVDDAMLKLLRGPVPREALDLIVLGLNHEEQHQELIVTDGLHLFSCSPLLPAFDPKPAPAPTADPGSLRWRAHAGGLVSIGRPQGEGFSFDSEGPEHLVHLRPFRIADRLVTNAEWLAFVEADGYGDPSLWLSDGFATVQAQGWRAPLYWRETASGWSEFGLHGLRPLDLHAPVLHVSAYEADAYARWRGLRLPQESEWEAAVVAFEAAPADGDEPPLRQLYDAAWQWTASAYAPYPGFEPAPGAVGEYNGKFMVNQIVLRGGSCATPPGHSRATYRNFFPPDRRWQMFGLRLAGDVVADDDQTRAFRADVLEGLSRPAKALPSKWLYDETGSALFEQITDLPEYYPTRTELKLLEEIAPQIAVRIPQGAALVEFGSGSSRKTRLLLDAAPQLAAYVPIDISEEALAPAARAIAQAYPSLQVLPVRGDFTRSTELPPEVLGLPRVGFFPGSTIGNFTPADAGRFLAQARRTLGERSLFLLGVDLRKDPAVLAAAYDDAQGVTAAFDLNLLARANRELDADFRLASFAHRAVWNDAESRVEMRLESLEDQVVSVAGRRIAFRAGEMIHTENSYKYAARTIEALAAEAGWRSVASWSSAEPFAFAVMLLEG